MLPQSSQLHPNIFRTLNFFNDLGPWSIFPKALLLIWVAYIKTTVSHWERNSAVYFIWLTLSLKWQRHCKNRARKLENFQNKFKFQQICQHCCFTAISVCLFYPVIVTRSYVCCSDFPMCCRLHKQFFFFLYVFHFLFVIINIVSIVVFFFVAFVNLNWIYEFLWNVKRKHCKWMNERKEENLIWQISNEKKNPTSVKKTI